MKFKIIITILVIILSILILGSLINKKNNSEESLETTTNTIDIADMSLENTANYNEVVYPINLTFNEEQNTFLINDQIVDEEIRVPTNTYLKVPITNNTDYETSVHFHGVNGLSKMDGVSGVTQDAIKPSETFTYEFLLDDAGEFMYHAHLDSANQVNNQNLYGGLVVEDQTYTNSEMFVYNTEVADINSHHKASSTFEQVKINGDTKQYYNLNNDEDIYLSIANLSNVPLSINFGDSVNYQIKSVDGNVVDSETQSGSLVIPTANRVSMIIQNPQKSFNIKTTLNGRDNAVAYINYKNQGYKKFQDTTTDISEDMMGSTTDLLEEDATHLYSIINNPDDLDLRGMPDVKVNMELTMSSGMWVINDKAYPNTDTINVDEGDLVEITLTNSSHMAEIHPFHLHGHEFQVMEVNGNKIDKNLILDTIEVQPGNTVTIRFRANNPGIWPFHCHDLTHAAKGMMTTVNYNGYTNKLEDEVVE